MCVYKKDDYCRMLCELSIPDQLSTDLLIPAPNVEGSRTTGKQKRSETYLSLFPQSFIICCMMYSMNLWLKEYC